MLKSFIEKPHLVFFLLVSVYFALYFTQASSLPPKPEEERINRIAVEFSQSGFFPKISLVRNLNDWGHIGYYVLAGRVARIAESKPIHDPQKIIHILRIFSLVLSALAFFFFLRLGSFYVNFNRLNPKWISYGLLVFALNPYSYFAATQAGYVSLLLCLLLSALYYFEKDDPRSSGFLLSIAVLVDWRALIMAIVFVAMRLRSTTSKLVMLDRIFWLVMPFLAALLPIIAWRGFVPEGEVRLLWDSMREQKGLLHPQGYLYSVALIPIYVFFFSWVWSLKARVRTTKLSRILTLLLIPVYFIFPIEGLHSGLVDELFVTLAGSFKNYLLFIPWLIGQYLFIQLLLRDNFEHSRTLKCFIILFFASEVLIAGFGDYGFLLVVPVLILFTLSEALVGEEGKLY